METIVAAACLVVFNADAGEGRCNRLRRRGNSQQLLQPSHNLSPFFTRLLGGAATALFYRCEQF